MSGMIPIPEWAQASKAPEIGYEMVGFMRLGVEAAVLAPGIPNLDLPGTMNIVLVANKHNCMIMANGTELLLHPLDDLRRAMYEGKGRPTVQIRSRIPVPAQPYILRLSCDESKFAMASRTGAITVWDMATLVQGFNTAPNSQASIPPHFTNTPVLDFLMNPADKPSYIAVLYGAPGQPNSGVRIWDMNTGANVGEWPGNFTSIAWSPRGKQLVTGCVDGVLRQWTPTGELKAEIPAPASPTPLTVQSVAWIGNAFFLTTYARRVTAEPEPDHTVLTLVTHDPKQGPTTHLRFGDVCPPFGVRERHPGRMFIPLLPWDPFKQLFIHWTAHSADVGLVGAVSQNALPISAPPLPSSGFASFVPDESGVLSLPLNEDSLDTGCVGASLDLMATGTIPGSMDGQPDLPASPIVWVLTTEGLLSAYWLLNKKNRAPYPGMGGVVPAPVTNPAPAANPFGGGNLASAPNPFSGVNIAPKPNPFGGSAPASSSNPFGGAPSASPFGGVAPSRPAFSSSTPFGAPAPRPSAPAWAANMPTGSLGNRTLTMPTLAPAGSFSAIAGGGPRSFQSAPTGPSIFDNTTGSNDFDMTGLESDAAVLGPAQPTSGGFGGMGGGQPNAFGQPASTWGQPAQSTTSAFGQATPAFGQPATSGFGQPQSQAGSAFGQPASTVPNPFGSAPNAQPSWAQSSAANSGAFSAPAFGQPASTGSSAFGQPANASTSAFSQPATNNTSAFGQPAATNTGAFGQPAPTNTGAFGQPAITSTGAFGQPPAASAAPATTPFGQPPAASSTPATTPFGQPQHGAFSKPPAAQSSVNTPSPFAKPSTASAAPAPSTNTLGLSAGPTGAFGSAPAASSSGSGAAPGAVFGQPAQPPATSAAAEEKKPDLSFITKNFDTFKKSYDPATAKKIVLPKELAEKFDKPAASGSAAATSPTQPKAAQPSAKPAVKSAFGPGGSGPPVPAEPAKQETSATAASSSKAATALATDAKKEEPAVKPSTSTATPAKPVTPAVPEKTPAEPKPAAASTSTAEDGGPDISNAKAFDAFAAYRNVDPFERFKGAKSWMDEPREKADWEIKLEAKNKEREKAHPSGGPVVFDNSAFATAHLDLRKARQSRAKEEEELDDSDSDEGEEKEKFPEEEDSEAMKAAVKRAGELALASSGKVISDLGDLSLGPTPSTSTAKPETTSAKPSGAQPADKKPSVGAGTTDAPAQASSTVAAAETVSKGKAPEPSVMDAPVGKAGISASISTTPPGSPQKTPATASSKPVPSTAGGKSASTTTAPTVAGSTGSLGLGRPSSRPGSTFAPIKSSPLANVAVSQDDGSEDAESPATPAVIAPTPSARAITPSPSATPTPAGPTSGATAPDPALATPIADSAAEPKKKISLGGGFHRVNKPKATSSSASDEGESDQKGATKKVQPGGASESVKVKDYRTNVSETEKSTAAPLAKAATVAAAKKPSMSVSSSAGSKAPAASAAIGAVSKPKDALAQAPSVVSTSGVRAVAPKASTVAQATSKPTPLAATPKPKKDAPPVKPVLPALVPLSIPDSSRSNTSLNDSPQLPPSPTGGWPDRPVPKFELRKRPTAPGKGDGIASEFDKLYVTMYEELQELQHNIGRCRSYQERLKQPSPNPLLPEDLANPEAWNFGDLVTLRNMINQWEARIMNLKDQSFAYKRMSVEIDSMMLKAETKTEECRRFARAKDDKEFASMIKVRHLGPEQSENQGHLRRSSLMVQHLVQQLEDHMLALRAKVSQDKHGNKPLTGPTLDTINRTIRNLDNSAATQMLTLKKLTERLDKIAPDSASARPVLTEGSQTPVVAAPLRSVLMRTSVSTPARAVTGALTGAQARARLKQALLGVRSEPLRNLNALNMTMNDAALLETDLSLSIAQGPLKPVPLSELANVEAPVTQSLDLAPRSAEPSPPLPILLGPPPASWDALKNMPFVPIIPEPSRSSRSVHRTQKLHLPSARPNQGLEKPLHANEESTSARMHTKSDLGPAPSTIKTETSAKFDWGPMPPAAELLKGGGLPFPLIPMASAPAPTATAQPAPEGGSGKTAKFDWGPMPTPKDVPKLPFPLVASPVTQATPTAQPASEGGIGKPAKFDWGPMPTPKDVPKLPFPIVASPITQPTPSVGRAPAKSAAKSFGHTLGSSVAAVPISASPQSASSFNPPTIPPEWASGRLVPSDPDKAREAFFASKPAPLEKVDFFKLLPPLPPKASTETSPIKGSSTSANVSSNLISASEPKLPPVQGSTSPATDTKLGTFSVLQGSPEASRSNADALAAFMAEKPPPLPKTNFFAMLPPLKPKAGETPQATSLPSLRKPVVETPVGEDSSNASSSTIAPEAGPDNANPAVKEARTESAINPSSDTPIVVSTPGFVGAAKPVDPSASTAEAAVSPAAQLQVDHPSDERAGSFSETGKTPPPQEDQGNSDDGESPGGTPPAPITDAATGIEETLKSPPEESGLSAASATQEEASSMPWMNTTFWNQVPIGAPKVPLPPSIAGLKQPAEFAARKSQSSQSEPTKEGSVASETDNLPTPQPASTAAVPQVATDSPASPAEPSPSNANEGSPTKSELISGPSAQGEASTVPAWKDPNFWKNVPANAPKVAIPASIAALKRPAQFAQKSTAQQVAEKASPAAPPSFSQPPVKSAFGPGGSGPPLPEPTAPPAPAVRPPAKSVFGPSGHGQPIVEPAPPPARAPYKSAFGPGGSGPPVEEPPPQAPSASLTPQRPTFSKPFKSAFGPGGSGPPVEESAAPSPPFGAAAQRSTSFGGTTSNPLTGISAAEAPKFSSIFSKPQSWMENVGRPASSTGGGFIVSPMVLSSLNQARQQQRDAAAAGPSSSPQRSPGAERPMPSSSQRGRSAGADSDEDAEGEADADYDGYEDEEDPVYAAAEAERRRLLAEEYGEGSGDELGDIAEADEDGYQDEDEYEVVD